MKKLIQSFFVIYSSFYFIHPGNLNYFDLFSANATTSSSAQTLNQFQADFKDYNYSPFWQKLTPESQKQILIALMGLERWAEMNVQELHAILNRDDHHHHYAAWSDLCEHLNWPKNLNNKDFKWVEVQGKNWLVWKNAPMDPALQHETTPSPLLSKKQSVLPIALQTLVEMDRIPTPYWKEVSFVPLSAVERESREIQTYLEIFKSEFGKYPAGLIALADLKKVAIVKELYYYKQDRAALPDFVNEVLYLDAWKGKSSEVYQRHVIHHEFYHLLEEEVFDDPYYKDSQWAAFNAPSFNYGKGGAYARTGDQYSLSHPQQGFINLYSMSGLEEDKADIFAALMVPQEAALLANWVKTDPILRQKVAYMKAFLAKHVPEIDAEFWAGLK